MEKFIKTISQQSQIISQSIKQSSLNNDSFYAQAPVSRQNTPTAMLSQNRNQKPAYSFPELRSPEILQCLDDLRIPLTDADLSKPTPLIVQRIYEAFAEIFYGR